MLFALESDNKQSVNDLGGPFQAKPPRDSMHLPQLHSRNLLPLTQNFPFSAQHQGFAAECPGQGTPQHSLGPQHSLRCCSTPIPWASAAPGCSAALSPQGGSTGSEQPRPVPLARGSCAFDPHRAGGAVNTTGKNPTGPLYFTLRGTGSQHCLGWKRPTGSIESKSWPCTPGIPPCAREPCPDPNSAPKTLKTQRGCGKDDHGGFFI